MLYPYHYPVTYEEKGVIGVALLASYLRDYVEKDWCFLSGFSKRAAVLVPVPAHPMTITASYEWDSRYRTGIWLHFNYPNVNKSYPMLREEDARLWRYVSRRMHSDGVVVSKLNGRDVCFTTL